MNSTGMNAELINRCIEEMNNAVPVLQELTRLQKVKKVEGIQILLNSRVEVARDMVLNAYTLVSMK